VDVVFQGEDKNGVVKVKGYNFLLPPIAGGRRLDEFLMLVTTVLGYGYIYCLRWPESTW
jgi:hypothetical protein